MTTSSDSNIAQPVVYEKPPLLLQIWKNADLLAFLLYSGLAVALTFPLIFQLSTHIRNGHPNSDSYLSLWYLWWYGQALEHGQDPSRTQMLWSLLPDVQMLISSVVSALSFWPIIKLFGPLVAYNLALLVSFPLAGFFTYKLAATVLAETGRKHWWAAWAAGFFFSFSTYHFFRSDGHLGLITLQWLPFYLWRLWLLGKSPTIKNALLAGLGLSLAALSDLYYLGYFVIPVTGFWLVWQVASQRQKFFVASGVRLLAFGVGLVITTPFYLFFFNLDKDLRESVSVTARDVFNLSADLVAWFIPNPLNPFVGSLTAPLFAKMQTPFLVEQAVFPGYILLGLGLAAVIMNTRKASWFWAGLFVYGFVLSLGPRLTFNGSVTDLPLPYTLLYRLPFLSSFRAPSRLSVIALLGLAILAGLAITAIAAKLPAGQRWLVGSLLVGALALNLGLSVAAGWPYKLDDATPPSVYTAIIASEPGDFNVLEIPFANRTAPLYYQTIHDKKLVGGMSNRLSNRFALSWDQAGYLGMFNATESGSVILNGAVLKTAGGPEIFSLDISFKQMLQANNIRFVIYQTDRKAYSWMQDYLVQELGIPPYQEKYNGEPVLAWRIAPESGKLPPVEAGNFRIRLGAGWLAGLNFAPKPPNVLMRFVEQNGQLLLTPGTSGAAQLSFKLTPVIRPQTVEVRLNGQLVGQLENKPAWEPAEAKFELNLQSGQNIIELRSKEGCLVAGDHIPNSTDRRCISFGVQEVKLEKVEK